MPSIVVCEDDPDIQRPVSVALRPTGVTLHLAGDGAAGLALIEREYPALVITDVAMPELDGLTLLDRLKEQPAFAALPVLVLTASAQPHQVKEARRRGATDVLTKPFSPKALREHLVEVLHATAALTS